MKRVLKEAGYRVDKSHNIWIPADFVDISYSDGDEVESRIASIIAQAKDLSVLSSELREHFSDWPSRYHLSGTRANLLRPFASQLVDASVLEVGSGCGAITRFLGEEGANVLALEGTIRRAAITRSRTRDLENVEVVAQKFDQFITSQKFDVITLIGVLEYANLFMPGPSPAKAMLEKSRSMLKPKGRLIIGIENQLGLKYFAGALEDHIGLPMYGLEDRYQKNEVQTYGKEAIYSLLQGSGFRGVEFLAPFPDYKLPISIITEYGFSCEDFDGAAFATQSVRKDYQLPERLNFSLEKVWPVLERNELMLDFSNSYLIIATNGRSRVLNPNVLAYHYSTHRQRAYCKETKFLKPPAKPTVVQYKFLDKDNRCRIVNSDIVKITIPKQAQYIKGKTLADKFQQIISRDGWNIEEVGEFIKEYLRICYLLAYKKDVEINSISIDSTFPGEFFDLLPQNIIVDSAGGFHIIDQEWVLKEQISVGWLIFRHLLNSVNSITRFGRTASVSLDSRINFFKASYLAAGFSITKEQIIGYSKLETAVQKFILGKTSSDAKFDWLPLHPIAHLNLFEQYKNDKVLIANLETVLAERETHVTNLETIAKERGNHITNLETVLAERETHVANLETIAKERGNHITNLETVLAERNDEITFLKNTVSWKITEPFRYLYAKIIKKN